MLLLLFCGSKLYTGFTRFSRGYGIYRLPVNPAILYLVDSGGKAVNCINDQHGNWRIENQIENDARMNSYYAMTEQQGYVTEKVLHVPTDIQTYSNTERVTNKKKRVRRKTSEWLLGQSILSDDRALDGSGFVCVMS